MKSIFYLIVCLFVLHDLEAQTKQQLDKFLVSSIYEDEKSELI
ncbi:MAG: hypothetical protein RL728_380, partial [Bacteroidota bacterium]